MYVKKNIYKKIWIILFINALVIGSENKIYAYGVPAGTIFTNIKDYIGLIYIQSNYHPTLPGELFVTWTNRRGIYGSWNGKYFISNGQLLTNNTSITIVAAYDISKVPSSFYNEAHIGSTISYVYYITNRGNVSEYYNLKIDIVSYNDVKWNNNILSLLINDTYVIKDKNSIFTTTPLVSPDGVIKIAIEEKIPLDVKNGSTNLIKFEIYNNIYDTNLKQGDKWPGSGAISPATPDTNDTRDFQISYITTRAKGVFHIVDAIRADDMIHTINRFDGTQMLGNTEIRIDFILDKKPENPDTFYLIYSFDKPPDISRDKKIKLEGEGLSWYAIIPSEILEKINTIRQFNFIINLDGEVYYRNGRDGNIPWSFNIKPIPRQRNDVNILCNLLNPNQGEKTILVYTLDKPTYVTVEVYSLAGEKVRTLYNGEQSGGKVEKIYWDGRNEDGRIVAEGLYFISVRTDEINELRKVIVIK